MKTKAKNLISQKSHLAARSIFWLYFFPFVIFGQEPVSRIEKLNIGHIHSALSISGTNLSNSNWGRLANDRYFPFFNVFENPAFLFGERLPKIIFIISPAVRYGITEIAGLSSYINPEIDANIESYRPAAMEIGYPSLNLQVQRQKSIADGLVLIPFKKFSCGVLYHRPLSFSLNQNLIGAESSLSTDLSTGSGSGKVILNNYLDAINQIDYFETITSFILAARWSNNFIHSLQCERLYFDVNVQSHWDIQGSMFFNGKEHLFNDQASLWPTDIKQNLQAHYAGVGWRFTYGGLYFIKSNCIIDALISFSSSARLTGNLSGTRNTIPALNVHAFENSAGIDEILDAEKLDPSQLTYTEPFAWNNYPSAKHTVPHKFKIGFYVKTANWKFYFSDLFYFGQYRLQYGSDYVELVPKQKLNFYLCHHHFFTKLEMFLFKYQSPKAQDLAVSSKLTILPLISLGYGRNIFQPLSLTGAIDLLPIPGVNFGIHYQF